VQARLRLSHYRIKLFTSAALKAHANGFGVAHLTYRGPRLQPPTRSLAEASAAALAAATSSTTTTASASSSSSSSSSEGMKNGGDEEKENEKEEPLFRLYDMYQSTTVAAFTALVARDLGLPDPSRLRLWAISQPWADSPSAPRELLRPLLPPDHPLAVLHHQVLAQQGLGPAAAGALLADQEMTLAVALRSHQDGVGEARVWAEVSGDGGLQWSALAVGVGMGAGGEESEDGDGEDEGEEEGMEEDDDDEDDDDDMVQQAQQQAQQQVQQQAQQQVWTGASASAAAAVAAAMQVAFDEEASSSRASDHHHNQQQYHHQHHHSQGPPRLVPTRPDAPLSSTVRLLPDPLDPLEVAEAAVAAAAVAMAPDVEEEEEDGDAAVMPPPAPGPLMVMQQPQQDAAAHAAEAAEAAAAGQGEENEEEEEEDDDDGHPAPCVLLFIKHLRVAASSSPGPRLEYMTHALLPVTAPVRALFEALVPLAADNAEGDPSDPCSGFSLMVEAPPSSWQPAPEPTTPPSSSSSSSSNPAMGAASLGHPTRLRCFDCPPPATTATSSPYPSSPPPKKQRNHQHQHQHQHHQQQQQQQQAKQPTIRDLRLENGQILVLHHKAHTHLLRTLYHGLTEHLLQETAALLAYTGATAGIDPKGPCPTDLLGSIRPQGSRLRPRTDSDALVDLFERLGNQRFRVRNTGLERQHARCVGCGGAGVGGWCGCWRRTD
jgi:hypothetical protein